MESKVCATCKVDKPLEDFHKHKNGKFGRNFRCKKCAYEKRRDHWVKNRDKYVESSKLHRERTDSGIYFVKASNGTYVGQSKNIQLRIANHKSIKNTLSPVESIIEWKILEKVQDSRERLVREEYWIKKLKPTLNQLCSAF